MSTYKNLMTVCCAAVLALGLAACGGGGSDSSGLRDGSDGGGGTPSPGMMPTEPTALETATELAGRLEDIDVDQARADAIEYAGKLSTEDANGDSAMAEAIAQTVLDSNMVIADAIKAADAVIEEAEAAMMAAEDIEDATERDAVMRILQDAIDSANELKTMAQAHIDEAASDDSTINTLGEAVAAVQNPGNADPAPDPLKTAGDAGERVAAAVRTALATITDGADQTTLPMHAKQMNDSSDIEAMTWAMIVGEGNVMDVRRLDGSAIVTAKQVKSVAGSMASDFFDTTEGPQAAAETVADGTDHDGASYMGVEGEVFCGGSDCKVEDEAGSLVLTGSWYFVPDSTTELYVATETGAYMVATMYARYGYWLAYSSGEPTGIVTFASSTANQVNLDLTRGADATADVTATYSGSAAGISVRDKTSGHFTANVDLTAKFGAAIGDSTLGGTINRFEGLATNPAWVVTLDETGLTDAGALSAGNGIAYGGAAAGQWTAQGYGPAQTPAEGANPAVNHRPEGFFGRFNANFNDGIAVGAYATRKNQ